MPLEDHLRLLTFYSHVNSVPMHYTARNIRCTHSILKMMKFTFKFQWKWRNLERITCHLLAITNLSNIRLREILPILPSFWCLTAQHLFLPWFNYRHSINFIWIEFVSWKWHKNRWISDFFRIEPNISGFEFFILISWIWEV